MKWSISRQRVAPDLPLASDAEIDALADHFDAYLHTMEDLAAETRAAVAEAGLIIHGDA